MKTWDFRIVHKPATSTTLEEFNVIEVYYDAQDNIGVWTDAVSVGPADDLEDLKGTVEQMLDAFNKPVLEDADLPRGGCFSCVGCQNGACSVG